MWRTSSCHCGHLPEAADHRQGALDRGQRVGDCAGLVGAGEPVPDYLLEQAVDADLVAVHAGQRVAMQRGESMGTRLRPAAEFSSSTAIRSRCELTVRVLLNNRGDVASVRPWTTSLASFPLPG